MSYNLETLADRIKGRWIVTVESCTGGMLASRLTDRPGSSSYFHHGYVTYANESKVHLGVSEPLLQKHGAVSREVALAMTAAALKTLPGPSFAIATTGIAGPGGGSEAKPVGLVYIAINDEVREFRFQGDRDAVRRQTVDTALDWLESLL